MSADKWTIEHCSGTRLQRLKAPFAFEDLVAKIADCEVLCAEVCYAPQSPGSFFRIEYCLSVGTERFDQFYNSEFGYRGAYYRSPAEGVRANLQLMAELAPNLLAYKNVESVQLREALWRPWFERHARTSLRANSSKVWLCEKFKGTRISELYGEWGAVSPLEQAQQGTLGRIDNQKWHREPDFNFVDGTLAPTLTRLHVIGAFINYEGNEWVPARKVLRAEEIHKCGWT